LLWCRGGMAEASRIVLDGFELGTDVKVIEYPNRYSDPRGEQMWREVSDLPNETINTDVSTHA
jgi:DNA polymerase-1